MNSRTPLLLIALLMIVTGCSKPGEKPSLGDTLVRPDDGMIMVYVPGGEFQMGSTGEEIRLANELCAQFWGVCDPGRLDVELPQHAVSLDGYWIDRTEVTNAQYRKCVEAGDCSEPACWEGSQFNNPEQPVVCVNWYQTADYCEWVGSRLPTEAEWEYAARGADGLRYPWGDSFIGAWLNYCDATCGRARSDPAWNDAQLYSAPVGTYPDGASWCGALDMAGNAMEWVADWHAGYDSGGQENPAGPESGNARVIRGGSWFLTRVETRSAWRGWLSPKLWYDDIGFRCASSSPP